MDIQHSDLEGTRIVKIAGRLDTAGVDAIETRFNALIVPGAKNVIVDLADVTFLASLGIRMLITTTRSLSRKGAKLVLYGATAAVNEILETTALHQIIPIAVTEHEALALATG